MIKKFSITDLLANALKPIHSQLIFQRRLSVLSTTLAKFIPLSSNSSTLTGLDIGCAAGDLVEKISILRPNVDFSGVDVFSRDKIETRRFLKYQTYDGVHLPFADRSFSFSMLVDVLHHTDVPKNLLMEASRVSKDFVLIKDHICNSNLDNLLLTFMDWAGNKSYGVRLPYNYLSSSEWKTLFYELELEIKDSLNQLKIYNAPISWIFGKKLHFLAKLK